MGPKGEPDTEMNYSFGCRPKYKTNSTQQLAWKFATNTILLKLQRLQKQYKAKIKCNNEPVHSTLSAYSFVINFTAVLSFPCQNSEYISFSLIPAAMFKP
jgi:hypothetical protein